MRNPYHLIYSLFYSLSQKMNGVDNAPIYNACLGLSVIILLNLVTTVLVIDFIFRSDFFIKMADIPLPYFVLCNVLFFCVNYLYFKTRKIPTFEGVNFFGRKITAVPLAAVYVVMTVFLFGLMMAVGFNATHGE